MKNGFRELKRLMAWVVCSMNYLDSNLQVNNPCSSAGRGDVVNSIFIHTSRSITNIKVNCRGEDKVNGGQMKAGRALDRALDCSSSVHSNTKKCRVYFSVSPFFPQMQRSLATIQQNLQFAARCRFFGFT